MWRLLHDTLPVRSNLVKRGVQCDTRCAWCGLNDETVDHLFKECPWAVDAWDQSPLKIPVRSLPTGCFRMWINDLIAQGPEEKVALVVAVCHGLWFARNKKAFEGREVPVHSIFSKACESTIKKNPNKKSQQPETYPTSNQLNSWAAPSPGWYKVNCDAAKVDDGN
ncbi:Reverse transcriptase zinc-binding domain [Sesbania bispinosa]|nr:Reverse transcriptase zinc-binding domain [Sesbania bispinosa]